MNNILKDIEELKNDIINSNEYKEYDKYLKELENNKEIKELINKITKLQKEVVKLEFNNNDASITEKELDSLFDKLNSYDIYKKYITSSKKLNKMITEIQKKNEKYFNSLIS